MPETSEELTPEEQEELDREIEKYIATNYPKPDEKIGAAYLLNEIRKSDDTIKTANLTEEEVTALRNVLSASLYCDTMDLKEVAKYFKGKGEVIAAPTLSRDATFIKAIITQKKELHTKLKSAAQKKGWFKKKEKEGEL